MLIFDKNKKLHRYQIKKAYSLVASAIAIDDFKILKIFNHEEEIATFRLNVQFDNCELVLDVSWIEKIIVKLAKDDLCKRRLLLRIIKDQLLVHHTKSTILKNHEVEELC